MGTCSTSYPDLAAKGKKTPKALDDEDEEDEDDEDDHESEHMGYEGPKPKKPGKKRATRPVQVKRRGQSPFGSEGGAPEGGAGPSGGEMAASAPRRRLARAGDGSLMTVALTEDEAWADAEVARLAQEHPRVGLSAPSAFDTPGDLGGVQRHFDFQVFDVGARDDGDPTDENASTDEIIARLQREHPGMFGRERPQSGNRRGRLAGRYPGTGPSGKPQNLAS